MEEEVVTLSIKSEKDETFDDKVGMKIYQEKFNSNSDDEKDEELSLLKMEVTKWKNHAD